MSNCNISLEEYPDLCTNGRCKYTHLGNPEEHSDGFAIQALWNELTGHDESRKTFSECVELFYVRQNPICCSVTLCFDKHSRPGLEPNDVKVLQRLRSDDTISLSRVDESNAPLFYSDVEVQINYEQTAALLRIPLLLSPNLTFPIEVAHVIERLSVE